MPSKIEEVFFELPPIIQSGVTILAVPISLTQNIAEQLLKSTGIANGNASDIVNEIKSYPIWVQRNKISWSINGEFRDFALKRLNGSGLEVKRKAIAILKDNQHNFDKAFLELRDFQLQLARLSLSIPEEQETSMNTLRSVFDTAELFNNHEGLRVVSNYIDENLTLDENKTTYPAYLLSAFYIKGLQAYRSKNNRSALKYLTPVWKNRDSSLNSIKDAGIASHLIGLIYSKNKGMFSEAEYAYKESLKLRVPVNDKYGLAQVYHSLGNLYKDHDKITDAENVYLKSIETGNEINHNHHLAQVYHSLGNLYSKDKNKFKEAESVYLKSLSLLKKLDDKYGLAQVYHSLGNLYSKDRNKFKEAESKYLQSLKLDLANNNNNGLAQLYHSLGRLYSKDQNKSEQAEAMYLNSINLDSKDNNSNGLAQVYTSYGKLKFSQHDFKLAKELFEKALKLETSIYFIDMLKKLIKDLPT